MQDAEFVLVDGEVFVAEYLRLPDEDTLADDIVLEATRGDAGIELTRADIDGAEMLGDGSYRLKSGALLQFLVSTTIH